jgi:broad specificity phosphatase PhoE
VLLLVRHGESTANAARLTVGRADVALTERGREQAEALRPLLGGVARVISSSLTRARETATLLTDGLPIEIDDRWIELDYGVHDLEPLGAGPADLWRRWQEDPRFVPPGGESLSAVRARVAEAFDELFGPEACEGRSAERHVLVVSHVSPIKAAVGCALGVGDDVAWRLFLRTGSLTRIGWGGHGPVLHSFNEGPMPLSAAPSLSPI